MYQIDYHADDYAASVNNSKRILELVTSGKLDSFSILPNMGCYEECIELLKDSWDFFEKKPLIAVHIDLIDGFWLSSAKKVTDQKNATDPDERAINYDIINNSWGKYFIHSFFPGKALKNKLKSEIACQIKRVYDDVKELKGDNGQGLKLRLDSHVHTHMIPIVFDAMMEAVEALGLSDEVEYVRNSREPFWMFFTTKGVRGTFPFINAVKNIILNILGHRVEKKLRSKNIPSGMLWGLMMSGKMDHERISVLSDKMEKYAFKRNAYLEILCHPGIVLEEEKRDEYGEEDLLAFFSENRNIEYHMIQNHR